MKKPEFIKAFAAELNAGQDDIRYSQKDAEYITDTLASFVIENLKKDGEARVFDCLTLIVKEKSAKNVKNPRTGEMMTVPAKKVVRAKLGKHFKEIFD